MGKKTIFFILFVLLLTSSLCFSAPIKIVFWDENAGPDHTPYLQEIIKKFNAANPGIEVEYVGLPWSSSKQKIDLSIAGGVTPDCSGGGASWIGDLVLKDAIIPLDPYFNAWADKGKFMEGQIQVTRDLVPNKKLYMLPMTTNIPLFWYRQDWFKAAGLKVPATWDEWFNDIYKLTDKSKNRYGITIRGGSLSTQNLEKLIWSYSGITDYFDKNGKCLIKEPLHKEFIKKFVALYKNYSPESDITSGYKEMVANFNNGTAAMFYQNLGSYGTHVQNMKPGEFAVLTPPIGLKGKFPIYSVPAGYFIYKGSKYPKETFKFLSFLMNKENMSFFNKSMGQLPVRTDLLNEKWITEKQHYQAAMKYLSDKRTVVVNYPIYLPDYNSIHSSLEPEFQAVLLGKKSVEDFVNQWATLFEKAKAEYDKLVKK